MLSRLKNIKELERFMWHGTHTNHTLIP